MGHGSGYTLAAGAFAVVIVIVAAPPFGGNEYKKTWSWVNKIVFVLRKINRPLLSSEIIEWLLPYEPMLQYSRTPAQAFPAHTRSSL
jgi:hypothetical protein